MRKASLSGLLLGLLGLVVPLTARAESVSRPASVTAQATSVATGLYKIDSVITESFPAGCVSGCPLMTKQTPAFASTGGFASIASASKIVSPGSMGNGISSGCAIVSSNLWCWGANGTGRVGNGSTSTVAEPVRVLDGVTDATTTNDFTCAVKTDATLVCAGTGNFGANAGWTTVSTFSAVVATGVARVESSWNGITTLCTLRTNGRVMCSHHWSVSNGERVWADMGLDEVTDIDLYANGPSQWVCANSSGIAVCRVLTGANSTSSFSGRSAVEDIANVEAVYMTNQALCVYANGALSCNGYVWTQNGMNLPRTLKSVGVMPKPLNIINGGALPYLYIVLESGILYADNWIFNCTTCYTNGQTISPVSAFADAVNNQSTRTFYAVDGIVGFTDTPELIPMRIATGDRIMRSRPTVLVSAGGVPISGATVTWASPDNPGQYKSSSSGTLTTDAAGNPGLPQLPTGPISFTISKGSVNGSYLQAANVTVFVNESGTVNIPIPAPAALIDRKVSVINEDGSAVPSAVVTIRNNYLLYNYSISGANSATWSAYAPQAGLFNQVVCSLCYAPPPSMITGADGSVTFKSYAPTSRSARYDVTATYDDTLVSQTMSKVLTSSDDSVQLPFLARLETPYVGNISTNADGFLTLPVRLVDRFATDLSNLKVSIEEICGALISGGLWNGTSTSNTCSSGAVSAASVDGREVNAQSVKRCGAVSATTNSEGVATIGVCFARSTYVRVRTPGVVPSRAMCVVVGGKPCGSPGVTPVGSELPRMARKSTMSIRKVIFMPSGSRLKATIAKSSAKICSVSGTTIKTSTVRGKCVISYVVTRSVGGRTKTISKGRLSIPVS